ncbi:DUF4132 domain-containing protein [Duganella sp. Root336D2]|uniref:DUF4132 domain-containing protein n=1 Tax=Duganella sp. Root336D2 TaxID=1736518 RepID=UPI0006F28EBB|nr:DUF4132 domain-containing protein [Duganella sp. Root336D2]KQV42928.1 hypothetical protein ASD07_20985 [Duganella sp. Root336D2]
MRRLDFTDNSPTPPWFAQGVPLSISPEMAAAALPSRRFPKAVPKADAEAALLRLGAIEKPDIAATDPDLRADFADAWMSTLTGSLDGSLLSHAILLALANDPAHGSQEKGEAPLGERVLDAIAEHKGLEYCVDAFIGMQGLQVKLAHKNYKDWRVSVTRTVTRQFGDRHPLSPAEVAMRRQLSSVPESVWNACADKIERAIPNVPAVRRAGLAAQLPERPEVSNRLMHTLGKGKTSLTLPVLLLTANDPALHGMLGRDLLEDDRWTSDLMLVATVVQERGVAAVPILKLVASSAGATIALSQVGTPEAIKLLAEVYCATPARGMADDMMWWLAERKTALRHLAAALKQWPQAGIAALAELGGLRGKDGEMLQEELAKLVRANPGHVQQLLPWVSPAAQAVLQRLGENNDTSTPTAVLAGLPGVLADPPWLRPRKKAVAAPALKLLPVAPVENWDGIDREQWASLDRWHTKDFDKARKSTAALVDLLGFCRNPGYAGDEARRMAAQAIANADSEEFAEAWQLYREGDERAQLCTRFLTLLPREMGLETWNALAGEAESYGVDYLLSQFGLAAVPGFAAMMREHFDKMLPLAPYIGAVELAGPIARAAAKLKKLQDDARRWLLRFPEHAIAGLIAPAIGKAGEERNCALSALRFLRANGYESLIVGIGWRYEDPAVAAAVRAMLDEDPLERLPAKMPRLPDFWAPAGWRRPVLNDTCGANAGKALPDEALDHIGTMLALPTVDGVYAGIAQLKEACTAESLANFSWDCFTAWLSAGGPSKESWALSALGWLGNDDTARRLAPYIRSWPGEGSHARAVAALDVLADIGSDVALMLLNDIAQKVKFTGLLVKAREKIDQVAENRGLAREEMEDRLAPRLGLDDDGSMLLDFGPRQFRVGFDEALKPCVRESDGTRLKDLPKPKKSDDEAMASAAAERFKTLKKDARTVASQQLARLEQAMCSGRRWRPEHFRQFLADHPLLRHLVQRLVWGVYALEDGKATGGKLLTCFRVSAEGGYTGWDDYDTALPAGEEFRVGLPHPLELPQAALAQFGQLFADYELLQPFAQLGRETYRLEAGELAAETLERWKGKVVATGRVLGLTSKGWRRGSSMDGGGVSFLSKPVGGSSVIELMLDPGIIAGMTDDYPEQAIGAITMREGSIASLDPVSASELVRDIESLLT